MDILSIEGKTFTNRGTNRDKFLDAILSNIGKYDIIITPEYTFTRYLPFSVIEKKSISNTIKEATNGDNGLISTSFLWQDDDNLYNSTILYSNGEEIFEYFKETSYNESFLAERLDKNYFTGNKQGLAEWNGKKVGVEICRDHGLGRLKRYLDNFSDEDNVDIHLVPAKGLSCNPANNKGEIFLLNDGGSSHNNNPGSILLKDNEWVNPEEKNKYGSVYKI